jgi:hypothetical protein
MSEILKVFENEVPRLLDLQKLYTSFKMIRVIKSRIVRWAGYEKSFKFWSENLNEKDNTRDTCVDEKIILICTLEKQVSKRCGLK